MWVANTINHRRRGKEELDDGGTDEHCWTRCGAGCEARRDKRIEEIARVLYLC